MHRSGGGQGRLARVLATLPTVAVLIAPDFSWSDDIDCGPLHRSILDSVEFTAGSRYEFSWTPPGKSVAIDFVLQYGDTLIAGLHMDDTLSLRRADGMVCVIFDAVQKHWDDERAVSQLKSISRVVDQQFERIAPTNDDGVDETDDFIVTSGQWDVEMMKRMLDSIVYLHRMDFISDTSDAIMENLQEYSRRICLLFTNVAFHKEEIDFGDPGYVFILMDSNCLSHF